MCACTCVCVFRSMQEMQVKFEPPDLFGVPPVDIGLEDITGGVLCVCVCVSKCHVIEV